MALVARGEQVHVEALGSLSIGGAPVRRDSLFRIASTTKPITAAATLALVREGLLELDEPVDRLLPELVNRRVLRRMDGPLDDTVPARAPVTVRGLLTFTFGFGMAVEMFVRPEPWPSWRRRCARGCPRSAHRNRIRSSSPIPGSRRFGALPLLAQPGDRWLYNTGAHVLTVLCARAAGMSYAEVLRTRVFQPLAMRDTGFLPRISSGWQRRTGRPPTDCRSGIRREGQWSRPPVFHDGAAGLVSTVDDLLAFARMLLRGGDPVLTVDQVRGDGS